MTVSPTVVFDSSTDKPHLVETLCLRLWPRLAWQPSWHLSAAPRYLAARSWGRRVGLARSYSSHGIATRQYDEPPASSLAYPTDRCPL